MSYWDDLYADGAEVYDRRVMSTADLLPHTIRPLGEVPPDVTLAILAAARSAASRRELTIDLLTRYNRGELTKRQVMEAVPFP